MVVDLENSNFLLQIISTKKLSWKRILYMHYLENNKILHTHISKTTKFFIHMISNTTKLFIHIISKTTKLFIQIILENVCPILLIRKTLVSLDLDLFRYSTLLSVSQPFSIKKFNTLLVSLNLFHACGKSDGSTLISHSTKILDLNKWYSKH